MNEMDLFSMEFGEQNQPKVLTVSLLTSTIRGVLEGTFSGLTVEGEISGFRPASTGHWYFSLKDSSAVLNCVMWRSTIPKVKFLPKDGLKVVVTGSISVYEARGSYQLVCTSMRLAGEGDILAMLEERKRRYQSLGYFEQSLKKAIPKFPKKVAVVTSPTGAALKDILDVTSRRNCTLDIIILPAVVQGTAAAETIAARIKEVSDFHLADVMIVGRGGGSIEDLLPFSEDCVIEAIHRSEVPVISAVGHEIDHPISDYVADLAAPTPSAAAELVSESLAEQVDRVMRAQAAMWDAISARVTTIRLRLSAFSAANAKAQLDSRLNRARLRLDGCQRDMQRAMESAISSARVHLDQIQMDMQRGIEKCFQETSSRVKILEQTLLAMSPIAVMERGFSIVSTTQGIVLKNSKDMHTGQDIVIRMVDGKVGAQVTEVSK